MLGFFATVMSLLLIVCSPMIVRTMWARMKQEEYYLRWRKEKDRGEAEKAAG